MSCLTLPAPLYPSASQQQTLLHQIPSSPPPPPKIDVLLSPIFTLLQPDWVRSFLFTPDNIHVSHLSQPHKNFAAAMTATRVDPTSTETYHMNNRYLFSPAFTVPPLTAGFGVMHSSIHAPLLSVWMKTCESVMPFRFVRDSETHAWLEVVHVEEHDCIGLFYSELQSTTRTKAITAMLTRSKLLKALDEAFDVPDVKDVISALLFLQYENQTHLCKSCGAAQCDCAIPRFKAKHAFDDAFFEQSMALHLGVYEGAVCKLQLLGEDREPDVRVVMLGNRVSLTGVVDGDFCREASNVVVRKSVKGMVTVIKEPTLNLEEVEWIWEGDETVENETTTTPRESEEERKNQLLEERRRKARARRERNRVSARRSHLKKKGMVKELVKNLDEGKKEVERLRGKEMQLRLENLRMRKLIQKE